MPHLKTDPTERKLRRERFTLLQLAAAATVPNTLLDINVVEVLTGRRRSAIYALARDGKLPFVKVGHSTRWRASVVNDFIKGV